MHSFGFSIPDIVCHVIYCMVCHQDFLLLTSLFYAISLGPDP